MPTFKHLKHLLGNETIEAIKNGSIKPKEIAEIADANDANSLIERRIAETKQTLHTSSLK